MKKKHFKVVNIAAVFIFIAAFFLNLQTGFNGSSGFLGIPAIAQGTGTGGGSGTGTGSGTNPPEPTCTAKADCFKVTYNWDTHKDDYLKIGEISCTGYHSCSVSFETVTCDDVTGHCN